MATPDTCKTCGTVSWSEVEGDDRPGCPTCAENESKSDLHKLVDSYKAELESLNVELAAAYKIISELHRDISVIERALSS